LRRANEAFSQENFEEAAYLSNEAADLISGVKASPAVVCPRPPDIPTVEGGPVPESLAVSEKIKKQTLFYSRLYARASQQMGDYRAATSSVEQAEGKVKETRRQKEKVEAKVEALKTSKEQGSNTGSDSAMAEALAALEKAKALYGEAEQELEDRLHAKAEIEERLKGTRSMFEEARKDPEKIDEMIELFDQR
jgi:chromosome segregation ATPase